MSEFYKYDPFTGVTEYFDWDDKTESAIITSVQDVSMYCDMAKELRNCGAGKEALKKDDYGVLHAIIPTVVQLELLKKGIDISNPHQTNELLAEIDRNYPYLKCTDMVHRESA